MRVPAQTEGLGKGGFRRKRLYRNTARILGGGPGVLSNATNPTRLESSESPLGVSRNAPTTTHRASCASVPMGVFSNAPTTTHRASCASVLVGVFSNAPTTTLALLGRRPGRFVKCPYNNAPRFLCICSCGRFVKRPYNNARARTALVRCAPRPRAPAGIREFRIWDLRSGFWIFDFGTCRYPYRIRIPNL
jgi:hypothetical protein